jgi:HAMP domain-containing protein
MRRRFMRRMGCFFFAFIGFFAVIVAVLVSVFTQLFSAAGAGNGNLFAVIVFGGIALIFISTVLRAVRRVVMPLGDLIDAAESVEAGDYSVRVRSRGPRELRSLARAFNAMSEHLGRSETERRRLLADVTHELRTPLTVIQGNLEALIDGVRPTDETHLRAILEDTHVLGRLIDDLRTISVAEAGALALHREATDVGALARETTGSFGSMADAAGITLKAVGDGDTSASVDPIRVREGHALARPPHGVHPRRRPGHRRRPPARDLRSIHAIARVARRRTRSRDREEPGDRARRDDRCDERARAGDRDPLHAAACRGEGPRLVDYGALFSSVSICARCSFPEKST